MSARGSLWFADVLRFVVWGVALLVLGGVVAEAFAETIPASGPVARWKGTRLNCANTVSETNYYEGASASAVGSQQCAYRASTCSPAQSGTFTSFNASYTRADCTFSTWGFPNTGGSLVQYCPTGTASGPHGSVVCSGSVSCPSTGGWTLSGSNCTRPDCPSGTTRQGDGSCLANCTTPVNEQVGEGSIYLRPAGGGKVCVEGCSAYIGGRTYTEGGQTYGQAWSYGVSCTGGTEAGPTPADEAPPEEAACHDRGMCSGTVSGATICVTCDSTSSETKTTKTETPPGAAGPTTTTTTTTTTCVEAGSCSTTTTSSTSGPGGSGTSSETTTKPSGAEPDAGEEKPESKPFCEENPESPICKVSSFSGTCGAEPACEGDAVQCAQAREAFKLRCALTPNATDDGPITSAKHSDAAKDALTEQQQQALDLINGVTPDPSSASRSAWDAAMSSGWFEPITIAGCAPLHMEFAGHSVTWDHCPVAAKISDIGSYALWFGLLVGGFVFLTGGRNAGVS